MNFTEELQLSGVGQTLMGSVFVLKKLVYSEPLHSVLCVDSQISQVGLSVIVQMMASGRRLCPCRASSAGSGEILQIKIPQTAFVLRSYVQLVCDLT